MAARIDHQLDPTTNPSVGRMIAESATVMIWIADTTKQCTYFNSSWLAFRGRTLAEEYGIGWVEGVHPDDLERCLAIYDAAFDTRERFSMDYRLRRHDGEYRWIRDDGAPVFDAGRFQGYVGSCFDVTEIIESRRISQDNERKFQLLVQSINEVFWISKPGVSEMQYVSPGFEALWGLPIAKLYEDPKVFLDAVVPGDREAFLQIIAEHHAQGRAYEYSYRIQPPRGGIRWISERGYPVKNEADEVVGMAGTCKDVTEERRLRERMHQVEKIDAIGQLAGGVAHDFNNQLAGVLAYADILARVLEDPKHQTYAKKICEAARRSADLIEKLLAFSRKSHSESTLVCLHETITETVDILQHSLDKRIRIRTELDAEPSTTLGDRSHLQSAILNLALNARDAMPEGGELYFSTEVVELDAASELVRASELAPGRYVVLHTHDSGGGIPEHVRPHLFEPFFTTKRGKGTGMGLASVYGTVHHHKGAIRVASELGKGSCFSLYLPLAPARVDTPAVAEPAASHDAAVLRVLLVDDEPCVRELATEQLSLRGHTVLAAGDGQQAIDIYREAWPNIDVVVLDMIMPLLDGLETFRALRAINPDVRAVLASGYGPSGKSTQVIEEGVRVFLRKPFTIDQLVESLDRARSCSSASMPPDPSAGAGRD